ncbi:MAG: hypothetical protein JWQ38_1043 [Flavipsychrobacter sp.]|nr:hypothetical protein [Flavipsychrobacter sp.]
MKANTLLLVAASCALLSACGNSTTTTTKTTATDSVKAIPMPAVVLAGITTSPDYKDASIAVSAKSEKVGKDSAKVSFAFTVKNYELKMQTADNGNKSCANSKDGQHIHFILDNAPYKALYEPKNDVTLPNDGKEHYLMAFLSRSYHESVKSPGAAVVYHFKIDEKGNLVKLADPKTPMLFYSRPKGDYIGQDTTNLLLDFYVWNCDLSKTGYKVNAEIMNENRPAQQLSTTLDSWMPRFINNLGTGKSKVTLTLVDSTGKAVDGPVSREFNLAATEAPKN